MGHPFGMTVKSRQLSSVMSKETPSQEVPAHVTVSPGEPVAIVSVMLQLHVMGYGSHVISLIPVQTFTRAVCPGNNAPTRQCRLSSVQHTPHINGLLRLCLEMADWTS